MGPKAKPAQPRALPHGKKDCPRRTPKHVADPAAYKVIYFVEDIIAERMAKFLPFARQLYPLHLR